MHTDLSLRPRLAVALDNLRSPSRRPDMADNLPVSCHISLQQRSALFLFLDMDQASNLCSNLDYSSINETASTQVYLLDTYYIVVFIMLNFLQAVKWIRCYEASGAHGLLLFRGWVGPWAHATWPATVNLKETGFPQHFWNEIPGHLNIISRTFIHHICCHLHKFGMRCSFYTKICLLVTTLL